MKNFDWTQFTRKIAVKAPVQKIYDAWTIPSELERWFLSSARFFEDYEKSIPQDRAILAGHRYKWRWFLWDGEEDGKVISANGSDNLKFTFAGDCTVEVALSSYEDYTIVSLTQKDIPTSDEKKVNVRLGCDSGWSFYLVNLKSVYEGGLDLRNKNPELKPMLNN